MRVRNVCHLVEYEKDDAEKEIAEKAVHLDIVQRLFLNNDELLDYIGIVG